jgi:S1-C subfamily serine protease
MPSGRPGLPAGPPRQRRDRSLWLVGLVGALVGALVAGGVVALALRGDDDGDDRPAATVTADGSLDIQAILDNVEESVVTIQTSGSGSGLFDGAGTGIMLTEDGMVLTNAHVISNADEIDVRLFDGSQHSATLVGSSPDDDLAVIQLEDVDDAVVAELGSSDSLRVGDPVIAIGNALNLGGRPTVTQGIVSATNRSINDVDATGRPVQLGNLIQTDAAINPGNSGGPLVDAAGQVVAVNTAIINDTQNIGFAIAIDPVRSLIEDLRNGRGEVTPDSPFLGVATIDLEDVPEAIRTELGITAEDGAFVSQVVPGSAADEAGIQEADVIVSIGGEDVASTTDVQEAIAAHDAGDEVEIGVQREGEELTLTATVGRRGD